MFKLKQTAVLLLIVTALFAVSCGGPGKKTEKVDTKMEASVIEVSIGGMTCKGCEQTIQTSISKLEGIKSVKASCTDGMAIVEYYPASVDTLKIKEAVAGSGYIVKKFIPVTSKLTGE